MKTAKAIKEYIEKQNKCYWAGDMQIFGLRFDFYNYAEKNKNGEYLMIGYLDQKHNIFNDVLTGKYYDVNCNAIFNNSLSIELDGKVYEKVQCSTNLVDKTKIQYQNDLSYLGALNIQSPKLSNLYNNIYSRDVVKFSVLQETADEVNKNINKRCANHFKDFKKYRDNSNRVK